MISRPLLQGKRFQRMIFVSLLLGLVGLLFFVPPSYAQFLNEPPMSDEGTRQVPLTLKEAEALEPETFVEDGGLPFDIRGEALREAALSYGARGGLAARSYEIRAELERRAPYLDKVYDFRSLLIPAPSGLLIEPPIVSESLNALLIDSKGTEAAVADRVYDIISNARIVTTGRSWRNYLERSWGVAEPPPDILRPMDEEERAKWIGWVREGWQYGIEQSNMIFEDDLAQLAADFQGMVRYRKLLAQGMVTPPYTLQVERGVTGGGQRMRVGDRAVQLSTMPELVTGAHQWKPASR